MPNPSQSKAKTSEGDCSICGDFYWVWDRDRKRYVPCECGGAKVPGGKQRA